ncbi:MAG TPA: 4-(cytidine 5'-diphospho)-2-C-methyl-D-erythritol kinase [Ignavibacteriaceae bacterium]|nr:4-(cytidine 5'-diphospho)-2-C-methyl-D-erythritol kinase [Ignavibacteriaceae bacterium]
MEEHIVKAPAKINFGLNVVGKRSDGYHNIETIFYPIDLFDVLTFSESDKYILETDNDILNSESDNLITKAKNLLEKKSGKDIKCKIHLKKNIPIGAGLGGGSSDAAATLLYLNKFYKLGLDSNSLNEIALKIGSDVPFFLNPYPSFASSRGEKLEQIDFRITLSLLLINPGIFVSTKWAYEKITPKKPDISLIELYRRRKLVDKNNFRDLIVNDFEKPVMNEFQAIKRIKEDLYLDGAEFVLMSGSGSSIFCLFETLEKARLIRDKYAEKYFTFLQEI